MVRAAAPGPGSRIVPVAELYRRYVALMAEQEREPVSRKAFGLALEHCGQRAVTRWDGSRNVRCRVIHERFMAPEEFDTEPARI